MTMNVLTGVENHYPPFCIVIQIQTTKKRDIKSLPYVMLLKKVREKTLSPFYHTLLIKHDGIIPV